MINLTSLKYMAFDIKKDFENLVVKEYPKYLEGGRYGELLAMIKEIETGELQDHSRFAEFGLGADELNNYPDLMRLMQRFSRDFYLYRK